MIFVISKELHSQIQKMRSKGGHFLKASGIVSDVVIKAGSNNTNPLEGLVLTNHGESRIKHCIKYDLPGFCRLITIQNNGICFLAYFGSHDDCEGWLEKKKGLDLAVDTKTKTLISLRISEDITEPETRVSGFSDYSEGKLYKKIKKYYFDKISDHVTGKQLQPFLEFESTVDDDELFGALDTIKDEKIQSVYFDVFVTLRSGDVEGAKNRILNFEEEIKLISEANKDEVSAIMSNDQFLRLDELEAEYLKTLLENKDWYDWMLFLHPDQKEVVNIDFNGSSRVLGVSGSGKTCVLVHRAIRLAKKYHGEQILILTLNQSLSKLIEKLISVALKTTGQLDLIDFIKVSSFWEICHDLLIELDGRPFAKRIFNIKTDRHEDTIDEVWDEFYTCSNNNEDANILFPIHQMLLIREIFPQEYIRQEFDWIRSAFSWDERINYLRIDREGRSIPFIETEREIILSALKCWEDKMNFVGAIDYLGLSNELYKHIEKITPQYKCILVDEVQDFGTIELKMIRKLVPEGENDLFLTGDIAQQVYNKQHKIKSAGIKIGGNAYKKIVKNYRNSREILEAAYSVYTCNVKPETVKSDDFELLNPEYANFSSPKPFLRKAININDEFNSSIAYLQQEFANNNREKGCIAICGYSIFEISEIGKILNLPVLDGQIDLEKGTIFLSDLEQTKGFEFDRMVIINCNKNVMPDPTLPLDEWHREISKIYVAMTRAKKELIISYSSILSEIFQNSLSKFSLDIWNHHVNDYTVKFDFSLISPQKRNSDSVYRLSGKMFLYKKHAIGISRDLQNKLIEHVASKSVTFEKRTIGWRTVENLKSDVLAQHRNLPNLTLTFGRVIFMELENLFEQK